MIGSEAEPVAFVSSLTAGHEQLRRDLFALGQELGRYVWVCEHPHCRPDLSPHRLEPLAIMDVLLERVRASHIYLLILGGERHGTPVQVGDRASSVSHFEAELFQAALHGKPVELFVAPGFAPGPRLARLLAILEWALPSTTWRMPMRDAEIISECRRLLSAVRPPHLRPRSLDFGLRTRLVAKFHHERRTDRATRAFLFLDGHFEPRAPRPDLGLIEQILRQVDDSSNQEQKLSRLWIALRELMGAPFEESRYAEFRALWNRALGQWESAAAWYGLHAHIFLGCRAAIGTAVRVRALLREHPPPGCHAHDFPDPAPGLASATYSIAKLAPRGPIRRQLFAEALGYLAADSADAGRQSDILALRGSILLRTGRLAEAVTAYATCLRIRETLNWPAERIGDSMSELGFAHVLSGDVRRGLDLQQRGHDLLFGGGVGFQIRAKKKLALTLLATGQFAEGWQLRQEARRLAVTHRMFDQL